MSGPDFVCFGMQKAGTQWLYDQLQFHPEFWMPPSKDIHFFDSPRPKGPLRAMREVFAADRAAEQARRERRGERPLDARDDAFFAIYDLLVADWGSIARYGDFFVPKGGRLSGEVTPGYSVLEPPAIRALAEAYPGMRAIVLLRDPVDRLLAQARMEVVKGRMPETALSQPDAIAAFAARDAVSRRSYPSALVERWRAAFGDRLGVYFFDDLLEKPEDLRQRILAGLGADPVRASSDLKAGFNRKDGQARLPVAASVRAFLCDHFRDERRRSADMLGGRAAEWPDRA